MSFRSADCNDVNRVQPERIGEERLAVRVGNFIPAWARRVIASMIEFGTASNSTVRSRWLRSPELSEMAEVCIYVTYAPGSVVPEYSQFHARAWASAGFQVLLVLNTNAFDEDPQTDETRFASGVLVRENRGYDFGAWASALLQLPAIRAASLVALVNDSMYGPLDTFGSMLHRARTIEADVIGVTESREFGRHFQSFLVFFRTRALNSDAFWNFWRKIRAGGRIVAVYRYELRLMNSLERAGLQCAALFRSRDRRNPTLTRWRELIDEGLPYLKIALLRDNLFNVDLTGWEDTLKDHGYDPSLATRHIR
jgi:lipopolysaccharide biosynthesis protein